MELVSELEFQNSQRFDPKIISQPYSYELSEHTITKDVTIFSESKEFEKSFSYYPWDVELVQIRLVPAHDQWTPEFWRKLLVSNPVLRT